MKLGQAIDEMLAAKKVKRPGWADACSVVWKDGKPEKILRGEKPVLLGHADLLADDWVIA